MRTFAISSLANPQILSPIITTNITVAEDPGKALVAIPYDPDPSLQQITFEPSMIKVILGVNNTVKWVSEDVVIHRLVGDFSNPVDFERPLFIHLDSPFEHTFTEAGEFQYADRDREWMRGIVWVIPHDAVNAHLDFEISGLKDAYRLNEPVEFTVDANGFETGCGKFEMVVERIDEGSSQHPFIWSSGAQFDCFNVAAPYKEISYHFPIQEMGSAYNVPVNQTGTYRATVSFDADYTSLHYSMTKEFLVTQ